MITGRVIRDRKIEAKPEQRFKFPCTSQSSSQIPRGGVIGYYKVLLPVAQLPKPESIYWNFAP